MVNGGSISDKTLARILRMIQIHKTTGITLTELITQLQISHSSVSLGLAELRDMGCIKKDKVASTVYNYPTNHKCYYCS